MQQQAKWLSTSVYCGKQSWSYVLQNGIHPFLQSRQEEQCLLSFRLKLDYSGGENIRLAMLAPPGQMDTLALSTDRYFKQFFAKEGLPVKEIVLPVEGIFLPFPANSIQYGLYNSNEEAGDEATDLFRQQLSQLILTVLSEENIEEETLICFAFYLHLVLIKAFSGHIVYEDDLMCAYNDLPPGKDVLLIDEGVILEKYEGCKEVLREIFRDIRRPASPVGNPAWTGHWENSCREIIGKSCCTAPAQELSFPAMHSRLALLINMHLGITDNMLRMLNYFIRHTAVQNQSI